MDERSWLTGHGVRAMLDYLRLEHNVARTKAGRRRLRLFVAACFRLAWAELPEVARRFVEALERDADGLPVEGRIGTLHTQAVEGWVPTRHDSRAQHVLAFALRHADPTAPAAKAAERVSLFVEMALSSQGQSRDVARALHAGLLREIFGNPFRPPSARAFSAEIRGLAQACEEDVANYPLLADALADLGEDEAAAHCRRSSHVRGCHVVDWVLGKA
jgi:hypothetical protein